MAKRAPKGWHKEDIKAEIRKTGITLTDLALENGLCASACRVALTQPLYAGEQAIADHLGLPAPALWPDRYDEQGMPLHPRVRSRLQRTRVHNKGERQKQEAA